MLNLMKSKLIVIDCVAPWQLFGSFTNVVVSTKLYEFGGRELLVPRLQMSLQRREATAIERVVLHAGAAVAKLAERTPHPKGSSHDGGHLLAPREGQGVAKPGLGDAAAQRVDESHEARRHQELVCLAGALEDAAASSRVMPIESDDLPNSNRRAVAARAAKQRQPVGVAHQVCAREAKDLLADLRSPGAGVHFRSAQRLRRLRQGCDVSRSKAGASIGMLRHELSQNGYGIDVGSLHSWYDARGGLTATNTFTGLYTSRAYEFGCCLLLARKQK